MTGIEITDIEWDTDGEPIEECGLPETVMVLCDHQHDDGVAATLDGPREVLEEILGEYLSESFGFLQRGFRYSIGAAESYRTSGGGGYCPKRLGLILWGMV